MPKQAQFKTSAAAVGDATVRSPRARGAIESRTIRKLQLRLLPFLFLLYVISFVDRINIGFAALTMNKELAMTSQQFGFAAGVFSLVIAFSRSRAISCCTRSELASGLQGS